jgi:WhiB family redox-sensing transcriptional regulator
VIYELLDEEGDAILVVGYPAWMGLGACASSGELLEDFFVEETSDGNATEQVLAAKRLCSGCVVRSECLTWAMELEAGSDYRSGIFGGLSPNERMMVDAADDPIITGIRILDIQVTQRLVLTRVPRYEEVAHVNSSRAE